MPKGFVNGLRGSYEDIVGCPYKKMVVAAILDAIKEARGKNKLRKRIREDAAMFLRNKDRELEDLLGFLDVDIDACLSELRKCSTPDT